MRRKALAVVLGFLLSAGTLFAQNVHFKQFNNRPPTAFDGGLTLRINGSLSGLGNGDVVIALSANADAETTCTNQGGNQAGGQNPADVTTSGAVAIPASDIKNGNLSFTVATDVPAPPTVQAAGCPNTNWSAAFSDLLFTSGIITVMQNSEPGTPFVTVFTANFSFNPPTEDGTVPQNTISIDF